MLMVIYRKSRLQGTPQAFYCNLSEELFYHQYNGTSGCDHLSSAIFFPKYQKFPSQITIFGTSCKRLRPFLELKFRHFPLFLTSLKRSLDRKWRQKWITKYFGLIQETEISQWEEPDFFSGNYFYFTKTLQRHWCMGQFSAATTF